MEKIEKEAIALEIRCRQMSKEAAGKTTIGWKIFRAMRSGYNTSDFNFLRSLYEMYDREDGLADLYRVYLREAVASAPKVVFGPGRIISQREGRFTDIADLEDVFRNERRFNYNPFSGFVCWLFGLSEQDSGLQIDSILDPGGP